MNKRKTPSQGGQRGGLGLDHIEQVGQGKQFERFFFSPMVQDSQLSCSVISDSLRPHGLQQARPPGPSPTPGVAQTHVH